MDDKSYYSESKSKSRYRAHSARPQPTSFFEVALMSGTCIPIRIRVGLEQSLIFHWDLLGFQEVGRIFNGGAAALTGGRTHHELLLIQVGDGPGPPGRTVSRALSHRHQEWSDERTLSSVHMNSIWHKVETSSRIGSGGAELQARQP